MDLCDKTIICCMIVEQCPNRHAILKVFYIAISILLPFSEKKCHLTGGQRVLSLNQHLLSEINLAYIYISLVIIHVKSRGG